MGKFNSDIEVIWGTASDTDLEDNIKITILATGFGIEDVVPLTEIENGRKKVLENAEIIRKAEAELQHTEEDEKWIRYLLKKYYGEDISVNMTKTIRPKPFIFNKDNLDDNEIIEALINYPAYTRSPQLMLNIARKAEARRAAVVFEEN